MTVTVRTGSSSAISVVQGSQSSSAVVVKKPGALNLESLQNVNSSNLQDGYTLVYDSETGKWVAQQVNGDTISVVSGGTY